MIKEMPIQLGFFSYYWRFKNLIILTVNKVNRHLWGTSFLIFVEGHLTIKSNRSPSSDHESQGEIWPGWFSLGLSLIYYYPSLSKWLTLKQVNNQEKLHINYGKVTNCFYSPVSKYVTLNNPPDRSVP